MVRQRLISIGTFNRALWSYYRKHKRDMPWRRDTSPYAVVVSEIMLQQTQVSRVLVKFPAWMKRFPGWRALAKAPMNEALREWSGLGYNRRALYLKRIAETLMEKAPAKPRLPDTFEVLRVLPGIGPNTAGSILAFAFNIPHPFIETNIRSLFIHEFFANIEKREGRKACKKIRDDEIMPIIERALADAMKSGPFKGNAREWYWALMDYGAHLKQGERSMKQGEKTAHKSAHHVRQKPFKGSNRELRSAVLRSIMRKDTSMGEILQEHVDRSPKQMRAALAVLIADGFIISDKKRARNVFRVRD